MTAVVIALIVCALLLTVLTSCACVDAGRQDDEAGRG